MCIVNDQDKRLLQDLQSVFLKLYEKLWSYQLRLQSTQPSAFPVLIDQTERPGRPPYVIPREFLEELRGLGFAWTKIAAMFKVSRWTVMRRVRDYGLQNLTKFSDISDQQVDEIITNYILGHGSTTGEVYLRGHFRALGYNIQRKRIRESLNRVDPRNTALRWGALVSRRKYFVPWPNSLWHMDGHHSFDGVLLSMGVLMDTRGESTSSTVAQITLQQQFCPCSKMQFNVMVACGLRGLEWTMELKMLQCVMLWLQCVEREEEVSL